MESSAGTPGKNGGFFVTGASGTDYSQQNTAKYALTGVTSAGAGNVITVTSASADMVGNGIFVVSGTNFTLNSWFEIMSVVGTLVTCSTNAAGASICTGAGVTGVMNVGGANLLNSTLVDEMFEAGTAGNTYYIKSGTYTVGEAISLTRDGSTTAPLKIIGYTDTYGDACDFSSRPVLNFGAFSLLVGTYWIVRNINATGTSTYVLGMSGYNKFANCKVVNKSTTANRSAILTSSNFFIQNCEACSYYGHGIYIADSGDLTGNYIHSSVNGVYYSASTATVTLSHNLIVDCVNGIHAAAITGSVFVVQSNTICSPMNAATSAIGAYGLYIVGTLATMVVASGNIFADLTTGISTASNAKNSFGGYNNFYGNTTDVVTWVKESTDTAIDPSFQGVSVVSGATATTTAGNRLVQSGATFITSGVVAGRDTVYIASGTGVTAGFYGILTVENETTLILDITLTASGTSVAWAITVGRNFAVGPAMKALGGPPCPCEQTVSYVEQGAAQRPEGSSSAPAFAYFG